MDGGSEMTTGIIAQARLTSSRLPGKVLMKLDGKLVVFASDKGSTQLPQGAWSRYSGKEYALTLTRIDDGKAVKNGAPRLAKRFTQALARVGKGRAMLSGAFIRLV